uniref:DUF7746 domain-containing protein n=1 Tax=Glycine max TaxID=3847 RepID=A0A0R0KJ75_SOYBN
MVATVYQMSYECPKKTIVDILVAGFSSQLKGCAIKTDLNEKVITNDDNEEIPDVVNTLIFTIAQHFIGDPSLWKDRIVELISNLKCRTLAGFRWYRDTFLTRVYTREDSQQSFWKEKFLVGLSRSLGDKVRDKICSQSANGDIPYDNLSYGQLISYIQKNDKIQKQLAKEKAQNKKDLGSFYEKFGFPAYPKQKKKQHPKKEFQKNKTVSHKRFSSHISKYCRLKKKLRNLNLDPSIEEQINNLLIETSKEEIGEVSSEENLNQILRDDQASSSKEKDIQEEKKVFLNKLKKSLEAKPKPKEFITNNTFDVSNILKRLENTSVKPTTIQYLQTEINSIKQEIRELRQQQEIHQIILSHFEEHSDLDNEDKREEDEGQDDEIFMGLINKIKIQKFYINIRIIINDFVLDTKALFDIGADSNCIPKGLIPTKFFEKTSEKLSTSSGSKLKISYKLSRAIIENQVLRIETNFLLVKNLKNEVILGTPFIKSLFPLQISKGGITTWHLGKKITFDFSTKLITRNINFIEKKINQINFLKDEVSFSNIQIQLEKPQLKGKIQALLKHIQSTICSDFPYTFWNRKKHIVDLPYEKDFREKHIPTKAKPIQMNEEFLQYCQKEIKDLLDKGLIRKSKSPWSCAAFYVNKQAKLERGTPRLVIN